MTHSFLRLATVARISTMFALLFCAPASSAEKVLVADELARLAEEHHFSVRGLEQTEDVFGKAAGEKLYPRLRRLLEDFDHVIVQSPGGGVDRVIVLGEKVPFEPPPPPVPAAVAQPQAAASGDILLQTRRRGTQHVVNVSLEGAGGAKVPRELHVDTGADFLVLPRSLIAKLGLKVNELTAREMQTANGKVKGQIGILPALWLGESRIADIETAFIEDSKLGSSGLLGMSVLGRYKMTMDDEKNRITLGGKGGGKPADGAPEAQGKKEATDEKDEEDEKDAQEEAATGEEAAAADPGDKRP